MMLLERVVLLMVVGSAFLAKTWACCSCNSLPLKEAYRSTDRIVVGRVIDCVEGLGPNNHFIGAGYKQYYLAYTIKPLVRIKGVGIEEREITVYSEGGITDCGFVFDVGRVYTIFLGQRQVCRAGVLREVDYTNSCTATTRYRARDLDSLKQWKAQGLLAKNYCDCLSENGATPRYSSCKKVTKAPVFKGGQQAWLRYLSLHLGALDTFHLNDKSLAFSYIIDASGAVTTVRLWSPAVDKHPAVLNHVKTVLEAAPRWIPGHCGGSPVSVWQRMWYCPCRKD